MKIDVYSLPRSERKPETRTFQMGANGAKMELTLRAADTADAAIANEAAQLLIEDYITGSEIREAGPMPDPDIKPSKQLFITCATIAEMQVDKMYDAMEFVVLSSRVPKVFAQIIAWSQKLNEAREEARGK